MRSACPSLPACMHDTTLSHVLIIFMLCYPASGSISCRVLSLGLVEVLLVGILELFCSSLHSELALVLEIDSVGDDGSDRVLDIVVGVLVGEVLRVEVVDVLRFYRIPPQGHSPKWAQWRRGRERGREWRYMENKEDGEGTTCRDAATWQFFF